MILEKEMLIKGVMLWNLVAFIVMAYDKYAAVKKLRRVQEKHIFALALFLAAAGVYWGMLIFRHKTLHLSFRLGIPVLLVINIVLFYYIICSC
ncbi:MAG: DUF1294 domain-containing protein [Firmicutes bacterium]|nr:DUF1294 domain-containing protein [Bacillota bacterium]